MTLLISTPHQAMRLIITLTSTRKTQLHTTQSLIMITKAAADPSATRKSIESTDAEINL